jgi:cephalosporin-C deacetylase-like acetyl esterase
MRNTRRDFLRICAASTLFSTLPIGQLLAILKYRKYHQCLPDFLTRLATDVYQLRNARLKELTDQRSIREYQDWARQTFWKLIGGKLEKTPLNSRITRSFERDQYRVENIIIESQPGFHVPGNLYIPTQGDPPYPGVLFQMGHALNGKAARDYQRCCIGLVKLGFLVFGFDPMGQGERAYYTRPDGYMTRLSSADTEHTLPGRQMILIGDTSTRLQVWDAVRSLDFLESHPLVDPSRLASTGNSGGATLTMLLAARNHVSVPALIAAVLSPEIHTVLLTSGLISFRSIVEHEDYDHPFGNFVFGILLKTDLPQISALLKKRRLIMAGPVDSRGKRVPRETVKMTYSATENLELIGEPKWNLEIIESLFHDLS